MSFPLESGDATQQNEPQAQTGQDNDLGKINPAWNDVLAAIPENLHSQVVPHFRNWESGVAKKFSEYQQAQQAYAPYRDFIDAGVPIEDMRQSYGLLLALQEKPYEVIKALMETYPNYDYGALVSQGQQEITQDPNNPFEGMPSQLVEMMTNQQRQIETMSKIMLAQRDAVIRQEEEAALDQALADAEKKFGKFDMVTVLQIANAMGGDIEGAVQHYHNVINNELAARNRPVPPKVLGAGGNIPGERAIDPRKLDRNATKNLVADMLKAAAEGRNA